MVSIAVTITDSRAGTYLIDALCALYDLERGREKGDPVERYRSKAGAIPCLMAYHATKKDGTVLRLMVRLNEPDSTATLHAVADYLMGLQGELPVSLQATDAREGRAQEAAEALRLYLSQGTSTAKSATLTPDQAAEKLLELADKTDRLRTILRSLDELREQLTGGEQLFSWEAGCALLPWESRK